VKREGGSRGGWKYAFWKLFACGVRGQCGEAGRRRRGRRKSGEA